MLAWIELKAPVPLTVTTSVEEPVPNNPVKPSVTPVIEVVPSYVLLTLLALGVSCFGVTARLPTIFSDRKFPPEMLGLLSVIA